MRSRLFAVASLAAVVVLAAGVAAAEVRDWTSGSGDSVRAEFVEMRGGMVVLRTAAGSRVSIGLNELSLADREYLAGLSVAAPAGQAGGTVVFSFDTKSTGSDFAPRHVLAVWVTDSKGRFIKTLECREKNYGRYLVQWARAAGGNKTDAVTGASLKTHGAHRVTWDCRNAAGETVPDGEYRIRVEFSERNGPGPLLPDDHVRFIKGPEAKTARPADTAYFKNMALSFTPAGAPVGD